eukprot:17520-Heterococcus_DN1.PRE.2
MMTRYSQGQTYNSNTTAIMHKFAHSPKERAVKIAMPSAYMKDPSCILLLLTRLYACCVAQ